MAKREGAALVIEKLGQLNTQSTQKKQNTQSTQEKKKVGRPSNNKETVRYNLVLDKDLDYYLYNIAWANHTSVTQYVNDLIRKDMEKFDKSGGNREGWKEKPIR